jgi:tetraprenyl-beta-curcumene synthase
LFRLNKRTELLLPRGPLRLMRGVYRHVLPGVRDALGQWRDMAERIPNLELRKQALASIDTKAFHCQGGAVYALLHPPKRAMLIRLIVALQTISDYLDNLCDRSTSLDPEDFRLLHQSMLDAVDRTAPIRDYYALREDKDDGGYLAALVRECQVCIRELPGYGQSEADVTRLVGLYSDLQVYKHIDHNHREAALLSWWEQNRSSVAELKWNEFAAATGSTLGMFMLLVAAADEDLTVEQASAIREAYFPYVCGLHIMLDYLIDQEEDQIGGDLNFCHYYPDSDTAVSRLEWIVDQARVKVKSLHLTTFHRMIIEGLVALYLSDPKIKGQATVRSAAKRLMKNSPMTRLFFWVNSMWIRSRF